MSTKRSEVKRTLVVQSDDVTYEGEIMTVASTMLGYEDHGIFTAIIELQSGSSHQSAGAYFLDDRRHKDHDDGPDPVGTAAGIDYLQRVMRVLAVESWEQVKGKRVIALRAKAFGTIVGLSNIDEADRVFIVQEWADEWRELRESRKVPS